MKLIPFSNGNLDTVKEYFSLWNDLWYRRTYKKNNEIEICDVCIGMVKPVELGTCFIYCSEYEDTTEYGKLITTVKENAISRARRDDIPMLNNTLYITNSPCYSCSKYISKSGIKKVKYIDQYKDISGIKLLKHKNVIVETLNVLQI